MPLLDFVRKRAVAVGAADEHDGRGVNSAGRRGGRDADSSRSVVAPKNVLAFHRRPAQPAHRAIVGHERADGRHRAGRRAPGGLHAFLRFQRLVQPVRVAMRIERPAVQRVHERNAVFARHVILIGFVNCMGEDDLDDLERGGGMPNAAQRLFPSPFGETRREGGGVEREKQLAV